MKRATLTLALVVLAGEFIVAHATADDKNVRLVDMYARKEADAYVVHILADGDVSDFATSQVPSPDGSYKLTLDVPALAPTGSKYDVETPFSQRFQVWPMQLRKRNYSRIAIDLSNNSSTVVGIENPGHLFIKIQSKTSDVAATRPPPAAPTRAAAAPRPQQPESESPQMPEVLNDPRIANTIVGVLPVENTTYNDSNQNPSGSSPGAPTPGRDLANSPVSREPDVVAPEPVADLSSDPSGSFSYNENGTSENEGTDDAFFSLFPAAAQQRPEHSLFTPEPGLFEDPEQANGIRLGRFNLEPRIEINLLRGDNLLLADSISIVERGLLVRGGATATLLDSDHELSISYQGNYRRFGEFQLAEPFSHFVEVESTVYVSPRAQLRLSDRVVSGAFESAEIDPGRELFISLEPFLRNFVTGAFQFDVSERLGFEVTGAQNHLEFTDQETEFFGYNTSNVGGNFLYHLSPTKSVTAGYQRSMTPRNVSRPESESTADNFTVGLRGEISATLAGHVSVGFSRQDFDFTGQQYRGFIANANIVRHFNDATALFLTAGRQTNLSNFEQNSHYISNHGSAQFMMPLRRHLRLRARGSLFFNQYPLTTQEFGIQREDKAFVGSVGIAYYPTPFMSIGVDLWHDRRISNLEAFEYRNNVIQLGVGFGYLRNQ